MMKFKEGNMFILVEQIKDPQGVSKTYLPKMAEWKQKGN